MDKQEVIEALRRELPPVIARHAIGRLLGEIVHPRTVANLDSRGEGPPRIRLGRKIAYPRDSFLEWFAARMTVIEEKSIPESEY